MQKEILTPEFGSGLENILLFRKDSLYGILNGVDIHYGTGNRTVISLLIITRQYFRKIKE